MKKAKYKMRVSNRYNKCSRLSRDCSSDKNNYLSVYQTKVNSRYSKEEDSNLSKIRNQNTLKKYNRDKWNVGPFEIKCHDCKSILSIYNTHIFLKATELENSQAKIQIQLTGKYQFCSTTFIRFNSFVSPHMIGNCVFINKKGYIKGGQNG